MSKIYSIVKIGEGAFLDFIWMSYRYCIGRHTIAAASHADTIARAIKSNPKALSDERKAFTVLDIRRSINEAFRWNCAIDIEGCRDMDAFSAVMYKSADLDEPELCKFFVDTTRQDVIVEEGVLPNDKFDKDYIDLIPWVKLANLLDKSCHKMITTKCEGKEVTTRCYPFPLLYCGKYIKVWADANNPCLSVNRWISQEYITKVEDL